MNVKPAFRVLIALTLTTASYAEARNNSIDVDDLTKKLEITQQIVNHELAVEELTKQLESSIIIDDETGETSCDPNARDNFIVATNVVGTLAATSTVIFHYSLKNARASAEPLKYGPKANAKNAKKIKRLSFLRGKSAFAAAVLIAAGYIVENNDSHFSMKCPEVLKLEAEARRQHKILSDMIGKNTHTEFEPYRG